MAGEVVQLEADPGGGDVVASRGFGGAVGAPPRTFLRPPGGRAAPKLGAAAARLQHSAVSGLPHQISTLLYGFNPDGEVLLLRRRRTPNVGLWSPPGGKLERDIGEGPHACARREAWEELRIELGTGDLRLTGVVSERAYHGQSHWLMFLFEITVPILSLPPAHPEGEFGFFSREALSRLPLPDSDRERLWPWFWAHRGGFFSAHGDCREGGSWVLEESRPSINASS